MQQAQNPKSQSVIRNGITVNLNMTSTCWESDYNPAPTLCNCISVNEAIYTVPVPHTLIKLTDASEEPEPLVILAIIKASPSVASTNVNKGATVYTAEYALIHTPRLVIIENVQYIVCVTIVTIEQAVLEVLSSIPLPYHISASTTPFFGSSFGNRAKLQHVINSSNQIAFLDDTGSIFMFAVTETVMNVRPLRWATSSCEFINNSGGSTIGIVGNLASDLIPSVGTYDYLALLNPPAPPFQPNRQSIMVAVSDYILVYNFTQQCFFFLTKGDLRQVVWQTQPVYNVDTSTVVTQGIPLVFPAPSRCVDIVANGTDIRIFGEEGLTRYTFSLLDGLPNLQVDLTYSLPYANRDNSSACVYKSRLYFVGRDSKLYTQALKKGDVLEKSQGAIPVAPILAHNSWNIVDPLGEISTFTFVPAYNVQPLNILRFAGVLVDNVWYNLETPNNASYLVSCVNTDYTWVDDSGNTNYYSLPKRITATSSDGQFFALEDTFCYSPKDYSYSFSLDTDFFSNAFAITEEISFVGEHAGLLNSLQIAVKDTGEPPNSQDLAPNINIGLFPIVSTTKADQIKSFAPMSSEHSFPYNISVSRIGSSYVIKPTQKFLASASIILCIQFNKFSIVNTQFNLQKFIIRSIVFNDN